MITDSDHDSDYDLTDDYVMFDLESPPEEALPMTGKVSPTACLGHRVLRATCPCCGGHAGVRRAKRRVAKVTEAPGVVLKNTSGRLYFDPAKAKLITKGRKPRRKDHRH